jgi:tetratricopeptide (TPR) repeat protein
MAPSLRSAGAASTLLIIAILALLEAMIARRALSYKAGEASDSSKNKAPDLSEEGSPNNNLFTYALFVGCLFTFFLIVRNLGTKSNSLWIYCSLFAAFTYIWRDYLVIFGSLDGESREWGTDRIVAVTSGLAPSVYYLVYGFMGIAADGFLAFFAAFFHLISIVFRNLLDGPLKPYFVDRDEREIEKLLMGYYGGGSGLPVQSQQSSIAAIIEDLVADAKTGDSEAEIDDTKAIVTGAADPETVDSDDQALEVKEADSVSASSKREEDKAEPEILSGPNLEKLNAGLLAWENNDEVSALRHFLELIQIRPDLEEPTIWSVQLAARLDMVEKSKLMLMEFLKKNPHSYGGFFQLAKILHSEGKSKLAARAFVKCCQISPDAVSPRRELALISMELNDPEKALMYGKAVLALDRRDEWAITFISQLEAADAERKAALLREEARSLLARQEKGKALLIFKKLAALDPSDLQSRLVSARVLLDDGSTDEAVRIFEQALSVPFEGRDGHSLPVDLAEAYCKSGEYEKALKEISYSMLHFPNHVDLGFATIDILLKLNKFDEVREFACPPAPENGSLSPEKYLMAAYALLQGELFGLFSAGEVDDKAPRYLESMVLASIPSAPYESKDRVMARLSEVRGLLNSRQGNYDTALSEYEKAVSLDPRSVKTRAWLGAARTRDNQRSRAIVHYEALRSLEPENFMWRRDLLRTLYFEAESRNQTGRYFEALLAEKRRLLLEDGSDTACLFETAMALTIFGIDASVQQGGCGAGHYLKVALQAEPFNPWIISGLKEFYLSSIGPSDGEQKAFELLRDKSASPKASVYTRVEFAVFMTEHVAYGKSMDIEPLFEDCLKKDPSNSEALYGLAKYLVVSGSMDRAVELFGKALRVDPFHRNAAEAKEMAA